MAETKRLTVPDAEEMLGKELKVLDKGFVRLVSYDGSDQAILEAARCSYQGLDQKVHTPEQDAALIDFLMRYRHCYDSETEALVLGRGFIKWPLIKATDKLGIWDDKNGTIKYEVPNYLTEEDYNGQMYKVDHGGIDLLVTPEHRMFVKTKKWNGTNTVWDKKYELISANTLSHKSMVRYKKTAPSYNRNVPPSDWPLYNEDEQAALWSFFGFFVGDGYVSSRNTISFHLKRQRKIDYLRSLCKRLGWEIRTLENNNYSIYQNEIGNRFNRLFYTLERKKTMPTFMQFSSSEESLYILEGLKNSDGSIKRGTWQYSTAVEELAHQVQLVGLHAGEAAHVYRNKSYMWTVMFLSRMKEPVVNQGSINTAWVNYRGKVYCAHTSTGVLVVRRNNKIVLSGNSSPFEMVTLKFHMKMPIFVARQIIRHRTASVNEYSGRYAEMKEEFYVPEKGNIRLQSKTNKQQSGEVAKDSIQDWTIKSIEENNLELDLKNKVIDLWEEIESTFKVDRKPKKRGV